MLLVPGFPIPDGFETTCQVQAFQKNPDGTLEMVVLPLGAEPTENQTPLPSCGLLHRLMGHDTLMTDDAYWSPWGDAAGTPPWPKNRSTTLDLRRGPENTD
jgi:hypothetical protein